MNPNAPGGVISSPITRSSAPPASDRQVLTVGEVALELRCSKAHVYNVIAGKVDGVRALPAISMGRRKLVRRTALEHWMEANEAAAGDGKIAPSSASDAVGRMKETVHA
jgi:excisionase family DNA binding protein